MSSEAVIPGPLIPLLSAVLLLSMPSSGSASHGASGAGGDHGWAADTIRVEQEVHGGHGEPTLLPQGEDPVPLYTNLGSLSRTVTTSSEWAQAYFDQGLRLTYGFGHSEGVRSFREAQRHDPGCAMCFWGEAWALGPYINARMDSISGVAAHAAAGRALELAPAAATPVEQGLIQAMAIRYAPVPTAENRPGLDSLYADAMRELHEAHPGDLDVGTLFGEALMVLRPWDHWTREGRPQPGTEEVLSTLEAVLTLDLGHPGACHLYIHAVEASPAPGRAAPCAELLEDAIPGASHIPHMPSHIWARIGRWGEAVRGNQKAWHTDQQAAFGGPPGIYPTHNLHMLLYAASYDGQSAVANQAARDLARISEGSAFYLPLSMARFGRWEEILDLEPVPEIQWQRGVRAFTRGLAHLRTGDPGKGEEYLRSLRAVADSVPETARFRGHPQRSLLTIAGATLEGELAAHRGDHAHAIRVLEEALPVEDALDYDEPEPWTLPLRHVLGAILLEAGDPAGAELRYREDLAHHPNNGWSLFGLEEALRGQGRDAAADEVARQFRKSWERSDLWIRGSRY